MPSKEQIIPTFNDFWMPVKAKVADRMLSSMVEDIEFEDSVSSPVRKGHSEIHAFFNSMSAVS